MATLSIYKGTALNTTKVPIKDGQLLFETDTKKIWLDNGTTREQVGGDSNCYGARKLEGDLVTIESIEGLAIHPVTYIEPKQVGTGSPSPTNVRAISGWNTITATRAGTNLAKTIVPLGITSNTQITCDSQWRSIEVPVISNTYYTIKRASITTGTRFRYCFTETKASLVEGEATYCFDMHAYDAETVITVQAPTNAEYMYVYLDNTNSNIDLSQYAIYEPHEAQTLTAELPETVYGGSLDWATGELTVTHKITTIGALTVGHSVTDYQNFTLNGFPDALMVGDDVVTAISDRFKGLTKNTISSKTDNYLWGTTSTPTQIRLKCTTHDMTAAEFKVAFADTQIVYRLAKPYTIQLTPQQLKSIDGTNCVWSNCGNTEATFNLTPEIIDKNSCKIVKRTGAFTSAHSVEGLAIHPISYMKPTQVGEGIPSPDNVRTISGFDKLEVNRTGKNILSCKDLRALPYTANGITFSYAGEGKISINGTATSTTNLSLNAYSAGRRTFLPAGTYTLSGLTSGSGAKITFIVYETQDSTDSLLATDINDTVKARTFHIDKDAYFGCYFSISNRTTVDAIVSPQLERSQIATEYKPYDGDTLSVEFPETVYGGTYDWTTGILTVDSVIVSLTGDMIASLSANSAGVPIGRIRKTSLSVACADDYANAAICCSHYPVITPSDDFGIRIGDVYVYIYDTRFTDVETTRTIFNNENPQLVYKIAEPYTIQLTPQQLKTTNGTNIVHSSAQKTEAIFNLTPTNTSKTRGVYYIEGSSEGTAGTWLGEHPEITEYYEGLTIAYKVGIAGASTTTLNINNLGAVTVVKNVNTAISTSYGVNSIVLLVYTLDGNETYWKVANYDSNTESTTGTSNKSNTKLFLTGATTQASSATTYSNINVYIGTDNCLYSGGAKVATASEVAAVSNLVGDTAVSTQISTAINSLTLSADKVTAGTFAGQVVAKSSAQTPGTSLLRNSKLVASETNPSQNGEICWIYE